jgi:hypothetical protein
MKTKKNPVFSSEIEFTPEVVDQFIEDLEMRGGYYDWLSARKLFIRLGHAASDWPSWIKEHFENNEFITFLSDYFGDYSRARTNPKSRLEVSIGFAKRLVIGSSIKDKSELYQLLSAAERELKSRKIESECDRKDSIRAIRLTLEDLTKEAEALC